MGWRTTGGPWYNAVLDWIAGDLKEMGFSQGIQSDGDYKYWMQEETSYSGRIWDPKYASLEIVGPEGDDNFDFTLDTFDPTSTYYPQDITYDWIIHNIGSAREASMNQRARLASNSGFTDSPPTRPEDAQGKTGEFVYVGEVYRNSQTKRYYWTNPDNQGISLAGKFIFATNSRSNTYRLALQEGAFASLSSEINDYNDPIIDGVELNPTIAKYASVPNQPPTSTNPVAFNLSPQDARYLISLYDPQAPIFMRAVAIGDFYSYSNERPLKILIAEIKGSSKPDERLVFAAHVQEPGAADNGSGVGLQLEIARVLMKLIQEGKLARPERTMTFLWGVEMTQVSLWAAAHPDEMLKVKAGLILDMVGEDPAKCGGIMRIEKTPDPSAVYTYGLDLLPGEEPPPMTDAYVRQPDKHTLWGAGEFTWPFPGFFLNDLYFQSASLVSEDFPGWQVGWNPYEGGSDHDSFLWYETDSGPNPIPAVLTWHFTDYFYHSNLDTMDKVSADELRNVGITTINVGYFQAIAEEEQAIGIMEIVRRHAWQRFDWEEANSKGALTWAYEKALSESKSKTEIKAAIDDALKLEMEILTAWATWYKEAITSARSLVGTDVSIRYQQLEQRNLREMDSKLDYAVMKATQFADSLKRQV
jgi:hypothetical protein